MEQSWVEMELHPQQHPLPEGKAVQALSLLCPVHGPALKVLCGVTLYKFLNISEPVFPKSLRETNTIRAIYLFPASSLNIEIPSH